MLIGTWNLNNRVGKVRFRPEAARAAAALGTELIVLTEYFPMGGHTVFETDLRHSGYSHIALSPDPTEKRNRILIASHHPLVEAQLPRPTFDHHFSANLLSVDVPAIGLRVIGVRVPAYKRKDSAQLEESWNWLAQAATRCCDEPTVIIGDLNARVGKRPTRRKGGAFPDIFGPQWKRHQPEGEASYFGHKGFRSEIDHIVTTRHCAVRAKYVTSVGEFVLAGAKRAISDHAALVADVDVARDVVAA